MAQQHIGDGTRSGTKGGNCRGRQLRKLTSRLARIASFLTTGQHTGQALRQTGIQSRVTVYGLGGLGRQKGHYRRIERS